MADLLGSFWSTLNLVPNAVIAIAVVLGAVAISHHALTIGGLVAFITLALQLVWPVEALGYVLASGEEAATAAQRVLEIFDTEPAIADEQLANDIANAARALDGLAAAAGRSAWPAGAEHGTRSDMSMFAFLTRAPTAAGAAGREPAAWRGERRWSWPGPPGRARRRCCSWRPGSRTRPAGGCWSAAPTCGTSRWPSCAPLVGCAFEEATLFSASVRENVTFGAEGASEEELEAALTAAQARFAYELPWGLDTRIGEQGMALSGGQRQRVALARAILARPQVLILDDPLSALDVHTEERVTRALGQILAGVTAIVVAHRPSTVALADRVALLDGGVIAATGSHRELMATEPAYANLMTMEAIAR